MEISQLGIMIFGCASIWLVGRKGPLQRWGYIAGLCGQPFWIYTAFQADPLQWGILVVVLWYTYAWADGIRIHWFANNKKTEVA